jgi:hypothetical protein
MPAPLRVHLSESADKTLRQLSLTDGLLNSLTMSMTLLLL